MDPSVKIAAVRVRMQPTPHCTVEIWSPDSQVEVSTPIHMQIGSYVSTLCMQFGNAFR